jgi:excisionase family DNA binding protein
MDNNTRGKIDMSTHEPKRQAPPTVGLVASDANLNGDKPAVPSSYMLEWVEKNNPGKPHFTVAETAKITGMSEDFIRDHIADGNINAINMGSQKRVTLLELARILEEGVN